MRIRHQVMYFHVCYHPYNNLGKVDAEIICSFKGKNEMKGEKMPEKNL